MQTPAQRFLTRSLGSSAYWMPKGETPAMHRKLQGAENLPPDNLTLTTPARLVMTVRHVSPGGHRLVRRLADSPHHHSFHVVALGHRVARFYHAGLRVQSHGIIRRHAE